MTQAVRLKWVLWVATLNALFALAVGALVIHGLRSAQTGVQPAPAPAQQVSCPAPREPDLQLAQTLQLLAAQQQTLVLRALQQTAPAPARAVRRSARRPRRLRPVCRR